MSAYSVDFASDFCDRTFVDKVGQKCVFCSQRFGYRMQVRTVPAELRM